MILTLLLLSQTALAVCNAAAPGTIGKVAGSPHFCSPAGWVPMGDGVVYSACSAPEEGKMKLDSNQTVYCNGSDWVDIRVVKAISTCPGDGRIRYHIASSEVQVCDGNWWWSTATSLGGSILVCNAEVTQGACDAVLGCHWDAGSCQDCLCEKP